MFKHQDTTVITDETPSRVVEFSTDATYLYFDLIADKGCSMIVQPIPAEEIVGKASIPLVIPNGGGAESGEYKTGESGKYRVTVTKTESGDMTSFCLVVRGTAG